MVNLVIHYVNFVRMCARHVLMNVKSMMPGIANGAHNTAVSVPMSAAGWLRLDYCRI